MIKLYTSPMEYKPLSGDERAAYQGMINLLGFTQNIARAIEKRITNEEK